MEVVKKLNDTEYELEIISNKVISFKIEDDFLEIIDLYKEKLGYKNRSDLIRDAICSYLDNLNPKK